MTARLQPAAGLLFIVLCLFGLTRMRKAGLPSQVEALTRRGGRIAPQQSEHKMAALIAVPASAGKQHRIAASVEPGFVHLVRPSNLPARGAEVIFIDYPPYGKE